MITNKITPLELKIISHALGAAHTAVGGRLINDSTSLVHDALLSLGYQGRWQMRFLRQTRKMGNMRLTCCRASGEGIFVRTKPGDNSTCWESQLTPPEGIPWQLVQQDFQKLLDDGSVELTEERCPDACTKKVEEYNKQYEDQRLNNLLRHTTPEKLVAAGIPLADRVETRNHTTRDILANSGFDMNPPPKLEPTPAAVAARTPPNRAVAPPTNGNGLHLPQQKETRRSSSINPPLANTGKAREPDKAVTSAAGITSALLGRKRRLQEYHADRTAAADLQAQLDLTQEEIQGLQTQLTALMETRDGDLKALADLQRKWPSDAEMQTEAAEVAQIVKDLQELMGL